ncbi:MAG: DUF4982 domain-containing protein [Promicromonosporaceae bacterium]|nr:DUF4982 domain-containing protein [Promicromonosporaceae bacterium]
MYADRQNWNAGWEFRRRATVFQELGGATRTWTEVTLPHDALIGAERDPSLADGHTNGWHPGGAFEYRKTLNTKASDAGKRFYLELDGVYRDAAVYVNGVLAGQWAYGYTRFLVRLDEHLRFGVGDEPTANEVKVECRTHADSRWYAGAGIHRDVFLVVKEPLHLANDGVVITTPEVDDEFATVEVAVSATNGTLLTASPRVSIVLTDPAGARVAEGSTPITLRPGESGTARLRLPVPEPRRWSVEHPDLYTATVSLATGDQADTANPADIETVPFGIRTIAYDARRGLRLNGEPTLLRGACLHADNGPLGAVSVLVAEERRVARLKAAGFNAIRMSHHPAGSALLDACDRLGMLVMDESWDMWTSAKSDFDASYNFLDWWERDLTALVAKDRNHPSVIMYSIGNEIPELGQPDGGRWSRILAEKVRELDPTRPVTNGVNGFVAAIDMVLAGMARQREALTQAAATGEGGGVNTMMAQISDQMNLISAAPPVSARIEEAVEALDIAGFNYGDGRYEIDTERVVVGTETFPNRIANNWQLVKTLPNVIGDFTWTGWDYLGEVGVGRIGYPGEDGQIVRPMSDGYPGLTAFTGDIDIVGYRRPISYYREIVFGLRQEPYLAVQRPEHYGKPQLRGPWAWSDSVSTWTWEGFEGQPVVVEVYADADEVALYLDGAEVGKGVFGEQLPYVASVEMTYAPGELVAVCSRAGSEIGRTTLNSAGPELVLTATPDRVELQAANDLGYVDLELTDGAGILRADRDRPVTVSVTGPGELVALGSGNPRTAEPFTGPTRDLFDGRALAIIRPTGPGEITISVTADGCAPATATLITR